MKPGGSVVKKYRKKPIVIEAMRWFNDVKSMSALIEWCNKFEIIKDNIVIKTLEGDMKVSVGDCILKGIEGEFYPCKFDIFEKTYEEVE